MLKRLVTSKKSGVLEGRPDVQPGTVIFYPIRKEDAKGFAAGDLVEGVAGKINVTEKTDIKGRTICYGWFRPVKHFTGKGL